MPHPTLLSAALGLLAALAPSAVASDHWIDPVHGSDGASGASPATAWRTLTHALDVVDPSLAGEVAVLHLLPGTYDAAGGEVFPLLLRAGMELRGEAGAAATRLVGVPGSPLLQRFTDDDPPDPRTWISGVTLREAQVGLDARASLPGILLELRDVVLEDNGTGLAFDSSPGGGIVILRGEGLVLRRNDVGARLARSVDLSLTDCRFEQHGIAAVDVKGLGANFGAAATILLERCRLVDGAADGLVSGATGTSMLVDLRLVDCLVAGNGGDGVRLLDEAGVQRAALERCTVAGNGGAGLRVGVGNELETREVALALNGTDLTGDLSAHDSRDDWIGGDPGFVDPAAGDWRPAFGSPLVDSGSAPAGSLDLAGLPRGADGDADTVGAPDRGALELRTLSGSRRMAPGGTARLQLFAPPGGRSLLLVRRGAPLQTPLQTPFGSLFLAADGRRVLGSIPHRPGPRPVTIELPIPPSLGGQLFTFQALSSSLSAPAGAAATTAAVLEVL